MCVARLRGDAPRRSTRTLLQVSAIVRSRGHQLPCASQQQQPPTSRLTPHTPHYHRRRPLMCAHMHTRRACACVCGCAMLARPWQRARYGWWLESLGCPHLRCLRVCCGSPAQLVGRHTQLPRVMTGAQQLHALNTAKGHELLPQAVEPLGAFPGVRRRICWRFARRRNWRPDLL